MERKQELTVRTPLKNNLEEILLSRIGSSGIQISSRDCKMYGAGLEIKYYEDQIELAVQIFDKIVDCADIYFGIRANQMSEALTRSVVKQIMVDYPDLTVEEIEHCFERFVQPKTDWRNITKLELIEPIKKYYLVKMKIKTEISKLELEEIEREEGQKKANDFYDLSISKYEESLKAGKWLGDLFMAHTIHRKFRNKFNDEEVQELKLKANRQYNEYQEKNSFLYFAYSRERILAQLVIEIAIENKWQIRS
jgi:hypothetical protein